VSGSADAGSGPGAERPRPLGGDEIGQAATTVARAFAWHEPWGAWSLPDERTREGTLLKLVEADIRDRFLPYGECSTIAGLSVTLWIPPPSLLGDGPLAQRRDEAAYEAYGKRAEVLRAGDRIVEGLKPDGEHWYLDTIATDPEWMGRGLGARLLDYDLASRDARGQSCALDTHTVENVDFYARRGFQVVAEGRLPGDGPALFFMLREPRGSLAGRRPRPTKRAQPE
jgi:ribosomal protein S18 acetylase RimI-like enzyme